MNTDLGLLREYVVAKNEDGASFQISHRDILQRLLNQFAKVDFNNIAFPEREGLLLESKNLKEKGEAEGVDALEEKIKKMVAKEKHKIIIVIEQVEKLAKENNWGLCKNDAFTYLYNGAYWDAFEDEVLQSFFGQAAEKMGLSSYDARYFEFRIKLLKQFLATAHLPKPQPPPDTVLFNLKNGTFEISAQGNRLRKPDRKDFITYQLPFDYNPNAKAPIFQKYLNTVLPDISRQYILSEYLAYLFIKPNTLKLEKTLLLYGSGANGKSVFFEVVNALLGGNANVSNYSLQSLTNDNGYYRAMLANKLVNYASEINGKLEASIFKLLVSGEPVEARLPYGKPFVLYDYAKLIFNCNELPKDVEQTNAYFRRFLIIPFDVTIPEAEQDKELSKKIIDNELSGVFNWVLEGLKRLLSQKKFTESEAVNKQLNDYKLQSDSVRMFIEDEGYENATSEFRPLQDVFSLYKIYCNQNGYFHCSIQTFSSRLKNIGFFIEKKMTGRIIYLKNNMF